MWGQRRISRSAAWTAAVVALQVAVCLLVLAAPLGAAPHRVPITITGPAVVADALAARANDQPGRPVQARVASSVADARADVERGASVAALVVDLRLGRATLLVSSAQGPAVEDAVADGVRAMAEPYAATIRVDDIAPLPDRSSGQTGLRLAVAVAVALGLAIALAVTWRRGPVADTWRDAAERLVFAVAVAATTSLALAVVAAHQVGGGVPRWWLVAGATVLATGTATLALEGLFGVAGIGVATVVFVVSAAPLARVEHPLLLPEPWRTVTPWLPHGAALDAARQLTFFDGSGAARPIAVLLSWIAVAYVMLVVARRERRRADVVLGRVT